MVFPYIFNSISYINLFSDFPFVFQKENSNYLSSFSVYANSATV